MKLGKKPPERQCQRLLFCANLGAPCQCAIRRVRRFGWNFRQRFRSSGRPPNLQVLILKLNTLCFIVACNDIVQEECFFEIRQPTNQPAEYAFAIRLAAAQAGFWETNVAVLFQSLTGTQAALLKGPNRGWSLKSPNTLYSIELTQAPGWIILSAAQAKSPLFDDVVSRISSYREPFSRPGTNYWLEADVEPQRTVQALALNWPVPTNAPHISLAVSGDGGNVLTHGELIFPAALHLEDPIPGISPGQPDSWAVDQFRRNSRRQAAVGFVAALE